MRTFTRFALLAGTLVALAPSVARATSAPTAKGAFQRDLLGVYTYNQGQVLQLLDAIPQDKFSWRPASGVRSIAEAFLHIAFSNYGLTKAATGKDAPTDAGWDMNRAKWDKKTTDKAEIKKILERSFVHVHDVVASVPDSDLDKLVKLMGHDMSMRAVLIVLVGHLNEHLGQEIAYARANNVTPPWSKEEKMPMPDKKQ